jgi:hypothetical protein
MIVVIFSYPKLKFLVITIVVAFLLLACSKNKEVNTVPPQVWPWDIGAHFKPRIVKERGWLKKTGWKKHTEFRGESNIVFSQTIRTLNSANHLTEIIKTEGGKVKHKVVFDYDPQYRITKIADKTASKELINSYSYYKLSGKVKKDEFNNALTKTKAIATHTYNPDGSQLTQVQENGVLNSKIKYNPAGDIVEFKAFFPDGRLFIEQIMQFDKNGHRISEIGSKYEIIADTNEHTKIEMDTTKLSYDNSTNELIREEQVVERLHDNGEFYVTEKNIINSDPQTGEELRTEERTFIVDDSGNVIKDTEITREYSYDDNNRLVEELVKAEDFQTKVKKINRRKLTYQDNGRITTERLDIGDDGIIDEERVAIIDNNGRLIEQRQGKPGEPFKNKRLFIWDKQDRLIREEIYQNGKDTPKIVNKYEW